MLALAAFAFVIVLAVVVFKVTDQHVRDGRTDVDRRLNHSPGFTAKGWRGQR